jgi:hypothetical protein
LATEEIKMKKAPFVAILLTLLCTSVVFADESVGTGTAVSSRSTASVELTVNMTSTDAKSLNLSGIDQYFCQRIDNSGNCLDGKNSPVVRVWMMRFLPIPLAIQIYSRDVGDGTFLVHIHDQEVAVPVGTCVVADVSASEMWGSPAASYQEQAKLTVCFVDEIWYFRFHY